MVEGLGELAGEDISSRSRAATLRKDGTTMNTRRPTPDDYVGSEEFIYAFAEFNHALFEGGLESCSFALTRNGVACGFERHHFPVPRSLRHGATIADEIALSRAVLSAPPLETLVVIVHEMVHSWQAYYGSVSRRDDHNIEWADRMELLGLTPSETGQPGGNRTGHRMSQYIEGGGDFERTALALLASGWMVPARDETPRSAGLRGEVLSSASPHNQADQAVSPIFA